MEVSHHGEKGALFPPKAWKARGWRASFASFSCSSHCLVYYIQMWCLQYRRDVDLLECIQRRATKMIHGMENISCEDRLREIRLFSLEKRSLRADPIVAFQYLDRICVSQAFKGTKVASR